MPTSTVNNQVFFLDERKQQNRDLTNTIGKRTTIIFKTSINASLGKLDHQTLDSKILIPFFAKQSTVYCFSIDQQPSINDSA